jgi:lysine 2,3-aminomutase
VISGGDAYLLEPRHLKYLGEQLLFLPNIQRIRIASKGLSACPVRMLDPEDGWVDALVWLSDLAHKFGKRVSWHTHFNHPNEISWISLLAAGRLEEAKLRIRNQTVLLRGVNDNFETMSVLFRMLEKMNVDMVSEAANSPLEG